MKSARRPATARRALLLASAVLVTAGCAPVLDWREVRIEGTGASLLFPCKPSAQTRRVALAGTTVEMALQACKAGEDTWALATADVRDPALVATALRELAASARRNVEAADGVARAASVPGATPNAENRRLHFSGRRPDGAAVDVHLVVFAKGTRVFQATVLGPNVAADIVETFLGSAKVRS